MPKLGAAIVALLVALALTTGLATAQPYPSKPIRLILPFPPGGPVDTMGRVIAKALEPLLKQTILTENLPGAGGRLGITNVSKARSDGYTIGLATISHLAVAPALYSDLAYDPTSTLMPISLIAEAPQVLLVRSSVPADDFPALIALAKAKPGSLNFASIGPGSVPHLMGEQLKLLANIDIVHVAYKGSIPALQGLKADEAQLFFDVPMTSMAGVAEGSLKVAAVASPARIPEYPNVPTLAELGLPSISAGVWFSIVAPSGLPPDVLQHLNQAVRTAVQSSEVEEVFRRIGFRAKSSSPEELANRIKVEIGTWKEVGKSANIRAE